MDANQKLSELVKEEAKNGNICFFAFPDRIVKANLDEFIKQPAEGILYDLNRDELTALHFIEQGNEKWVNNYAVALVIKKLKSIIDQTNTAGDECTADTAEVEFESKGETLAQIVQVINGIEKTLLLVTAGLLKSKRRENTAEDDSIQRIKQRMAELEQELAVSERLIAEKDRVLRAIPECELHGESCIPHALDWIDRKKAEDLERSFVPDMQCPPSPSEMKIDVNSPSAKKIEIIEK